MMVIVYAISQLVLIAIAITQLVIQMAVADTDRWLRRALIGLTPTTLPNSSSDLNDKLGDTI